jgi:hypothetical protein
MCRTSIYLALAVLLSLHAAIGCGSDSGANAPMPTQGTATDAGELFNLADFSITLLPGLVAVDIPGEALEQGADRFAQHLDSAQGKRMSAQMEQVRASGLMKMMAADMANGDPEFVDNMNVLVQPLPMKMSQKAILEVNLQQMRDMNIEVVSQDSVTANGQPYDRLHCRASFLPHEFVCYLAMVNDKSYTFTFSARVERSDAFFALGERVMQTVRLK